MVDIVRPGWGVVVGMVVWPITGACFCCGYNFGHAICRPLMLLTQGFSVGGDSVTLRRRNEVLLYGLKCSVL
jgi:hypothetical protein